MFPTFDATRTPVSMSKGQRSRSPGLLMLIHIVCRHIFRTARPTNFKLGIQMEDDDPHQPQALWPPRSKVKWSVSAVLAQSCTCAIPCRPNPAATLLVCKFDYRVAVKSMIYLFDFHLLKTSIALYDASHWPKKNHRAYQHQCGAFMMGEVFTGGETFVTPVVAALRDRYVRFLETDRQTNKSDKQMEIAVV